MTGLARGAAVARVDVSDAHPFARQQQRMDPVGVQQVAQKRIRGRALAHRLLQSGSLVPITAYQQDAGHR